MLGNRRLRRNRDSKPAEIRPPRFHTEREHERRTAATRGGLRDRRGAHSFGEVRPAGWHSRRTAPPGEVAGRCPSPDGRLVAAGESEALTPLPLPLPLPPLHLLLPRRRRSTTRRSPQHPYARGLPPLPAPVAGAAQPNGTAPGVAQPRQIGPC